MRCSRATRTCETARVETVGRGWEEPASPQSDQNRRVEVQWFTDFESRAA